MEGKRAWISLGAWLGIDAVASVRTHSVGESIATETPVTFGR